MGPEGRKKGFRLWGLHKGAPSLLPQSLSPRTAASGGLGHFAQGQAERDMWALPGTCIHDPEGTLAGREGQVLISFAGGILV